MICIIDILSTRSSYVRMLVETYDDSQITKNEQDKAQRTFPEFVDGRACRLGANVQKHANYE